jgi:hypothetical protein
MKRKQRKKLYDSVMSGEVKVWDDFIKTDEDFSSRNTKYSNKFYKYYEMGLAHYIDGKWEEARIYFEEAEVTLYYKK